MKKLLVIAAASLLALTSSTVMACGGENSGQHFGKVVSANPGKSTFTILDMETRAPVTFRANDEIIAGVQKISGQAVKVNYEENDEGALNAVGVTPM